MDFARGSDSASTKPEKATASTGKISHRLIFIVTLLRRVSWDSVIFPPAVHMVNNYLT